VIFLHRRIEAHARCRQTLRFIRAACATRSPARRIQLRLGAKAIRHAKRRAAHNTMILNE
jgi:hypothetical protein